MHEMPHDMPTRLAIWRDRACLFPRHAQAWPPSTSVPTFAEAEAEGECLQYLRRAIGD
jgi:hypothetical protein